MSGDGRWVAYEITTFDPLDPSVFQNATWLYDRQIAVAEPVSIQLGGNLGGTFGLTDVSDDGRYVVFGGGSQLDSTIPTFRDSGLYVRDMVEGRTTLLTRNVFGVPASGQMFTSTLADDGRYVAFTSLGTTLVGDDTNGVSDVFVRAIPTPVVESVTPSSIPRGTSAVITVVGAGFAPAPTAFFSGQGVTVTAVNRLSEHELSVAITVDDYAPAGPRTLSVTNTGTGPGPTAGDTGGCAGCLTVT